ncbi:CotS family spore coat protein [Clostridium taeniosporum]|uniref:CotS family spore coat protein n=1 Tax=Clostridium taeniosporum TaxID=394958 RepID=A0A1D7XHH2_9CLOT|nr:CotS family spore coat protein [Clostridium taeniosporum]AOR22570.1 CotS family spore coat protein [Clostridium taeniosporum]
MKDNNSILKIKNYIEENYEIEVDRLEKVKNSYRIISKNKGYSMKLIRYNFKHFYFIMSAIKHLQRNKFSKIPEFIKTINGEDYINLDGGYAYLTPWVPSRVSNYDNPLELARVSNKLAELHECSKNFMINDKMQPRIGWFSWEKVFETRSNEILDFKNRISQKAHKSEFDLLYLNNIERELNRAKESINGLKHNNYIEMMEAEIFKSGFCHHDYANHNILIDNNNEINIIDFDYCILDSHLHDLASLLIRSMKYGKWENKKADLILKNYEDIMELKKEEIPLIREFIRFPQCFWQLGIQVYWEQQDWGLEFFINKLNKYLDDCYEREAFIDDYFKGGD